jgi:mono/diheme cytochrome c family protein
MKKGLILLSAILIMMPLFLISCASEDPEIGIGPVKEGQVQLAAIDNSLVQKGKGIFQTKCLACHKHETRLVGPPLKDVTKRRKPEWIMNMILNPQQMTQENPIAKELFAQYLVQMTFQDVSHDDARALLEYARAVDEGKEQPLQ